MRDSTSNRHPRYRSLFWPMALIGVGLVWLLANLNVLGVANIAVLFRVWPLFLIAIGLDLLFGRQSPRLGALIGVGAVIGVVLLMLIGPSLGLAANLGLDIRTDRFSEPVSGVETAVVRLDGVEGGITVEPLPADSANLFEADLAHTGEVDLATSGQTQREITLRESLDTGLEWWWFGSWLLGDFESRERGWDVRLSRDVPLALTIGSASGSGRLNLDGLQLTGLTIDALSGGLELALGETRGRLPVVIDGVSGGMTIGVQGDADIDLRVGSASGSFTLNIADPANLSVNLDSVSGGVNIDMPEGAALRVAVSDMSGGLSVSVPGAALVGGDGDDNGVWETENFQAAGRRIEIVIDSGSGGLNVH